MTKETIYNEMMVHVPLCSQKLPENVVVVGVQSEGIDQEIARHSDVKSTKFVVHPSELEPNSAQVIIVNGEMNIDSTFLAHCGRALTEDGVMAVAGHDHVTQLADQKALLERFGNEFKVIMPYAFEGSNIVLASKLYHPTADVILHRADLLDGQMYYNSDVHVGVFAMPNYVRKALLGVAKN
jgi:spermidine synthase